MPPYEIPSGNIELPRNVALLDTNVLVAFVNPSDQHHEQARLFIEEEESFRLIVSPPVVVEACGLLSKRRDRLLLVSLLSWIQTPGNVYLLPPPHPPLQFQEIFVGHTDWMKRFDLDYVDAYLLEIANRITVSCGLRPYIPIVTFDTGDFLKCATKGYRFSLYDMRELALQEFEI